MAGRIIAVAQQKGGAGKTTLAAHLAVAAADAGQAVVAVDIDPQGSLTAWGALRAARAPALEIAVEAVAGHRVREAATRLAAEADLVIIDAPPHAETETRQALRAADLAVAPVQPSPLDLWAARAVVAAATKASTPLAVVFNRVPPRARIVEETVAAARELGVEALDARLGARVIYASSMGEGLTAIDKAPCGPAAAEARAAFAECMKLLGR